MWIREGGDVGGSDMTAAATRQQHGIDSDNTLDSIEER